MLRLSHTIYTNTTVAPGLDPGTHWRSSKAMTCLTYDRASSKGDIYLTNDFANRQGNRSRDDSLAMAR